MEGARQLDSAWWADGVSFSFLLHSPNKRQAWRNAVRKAGYLNFRNDGAFLCTGAGKGCQWGWRHNRVGAGEVAQVAAGNLILFMAHDDGLHDKEAVPRQPEGVLLGDERCPLEPQDDGDAAICDQVKAVWEAGGLRKRRKMSSKRKKMEKGEKIIPKSLSTC